MKKKSPTKFAETPAYLHEICDTCAHATFDYKFHNLSIYGKPTLVICDLHPFPKIVVGTKACPEYIKKVSDEAR